MAQATTDNNAQELLAAVNEELSGQLSTDNTATELVEFINNAISSGGSGTFPAHTVMPSDMGDIKVGEDIGGMTLADFIRYGINGEARIKVRFLHISDTHGITDSVAKCKDLMDNDSGIDFTLHTGDITPTNDLPYNNIKSKLLIINGNHDTYDHFGNNHANAVEWLRGNGVDKQAHNGLAGVVWGDDVVIDGTTHKSGYWYKDFVLSENSKLRIIAFDQYELDRTTNGPSYNYEKAYSQAQVEWVAAKMRELRATDYLVTVTHEPMVSLKLSSISGFALSENTLDKLFVSDKLNTTSRPYWSNISNEPIEHLIVAAYMRRSSLAAQALAIAGKSSLSYMGSALDMTKQVFDFSGVTPATFLFHVCGHMHADITTYLNECPDQLMLLIDCASTGKDAGADITRSGANLIDGKWYCINDVTIDFSTKRIVIKRIGGKTTDADGRLNQSRTRDSIYFPFKKQENEN